MRFHMKDMSDKTLIDYAEGGAARFGKDGYIEVTDEVHIAKMKKKGCKAAGEQLRAAGEGSAPSVITEAVKPTAQKFFCKACGLQFASKGEYMARCRTNEHKEKKA